MNSLQRDPVIEYQRGYAEGFKAAREKAAGIASEGDADIADSIRKMEP